LNGDTTSASSSASRIFLPVTPSVLLVANWSLHVRWL
jgi:hypothetical protein